MTAVAPFPPTVPLTRRFQNAEEWWHSIGNVPLSRVVMNPLPGLATEADLIRLADVEKRLCELVDATLVEKGVGSQESLIAGLLVTFLNNFVLPRKLGLVFGPDGMWRLKDGMVRLPDVAFISRTRQPAMQSILPLAPDLAVEVISESNTRAEMDTKLREYFASDVRLVWFVYPQLRQVAVYTQASIQPAEVLHESQRLSGGEILPGFNLPVADLFNAAL